jgi:hypothetical protein
MIKKKASVTRGNLAESQIYETVGSAVRHARFLEIEVTSRPCCPKKGSWTSIPSTGFIKVS